MIQIAQQVDDGSELLFLRYAHGPCPDPCEITSAHVNPGSTIDVIVDGEDGATNFVQLRRRDTGVLIDEQSRLGDGALQFTAPTDNAVYLLIPYSFKDACHSIPGTPWTVYTTCSLCIKEFPVASMVDLPIQQRMIEEMYQRTYPALPYYAMLKQVTPQTTGTDEIVGEAGTTKFDPIWGERVPSNMVQWVQPHGTTAYDPTEKGEYAAPVELHIRVQREAHELDLKKWGFDQIRDVLAFMPLSVLDREGIIVKPGDYFVWDGTEYAVLQKDRDGWWHNTTTRLYMVLNCEKRRKGS